MASSYVREIIKNLKTVIVTIAFLIPARLLAIGMRPGLMGAVRPQTPHRSPRQAFGGKLRKALRAHY